MRLNAVECAQPRPNAALVALQADSAGDQAKPSQMRMNGPLESGGIPSSEMVAHARQYFLHFGRGKYFAHRTMNVLHNFSGGGRWRQQAVPLVEFVPGDPELGYRGRIRQQCRTFG